MSKRKKQRAGPQNPSLPEPLPLSSPSVFWFPRLLGLSVFAGLSVLRLSYLWGVIIVYIGLSSLLLEVCTDPWALKRSLRLQVGLVGFVILLFGAFSTGVVAARAPINFLSYAMKNGENQTTIAGIAWDSHLMDLRVVVTNPSEDDYENLDVSIQPDKWTYKAALLTNDNECKLSPMPWTKTASVVLSSKGGATRITGMNSGTTFEARDNAGDEYVPLITESGYRVRCTKLPAQVSVEVVFALATVHPELAEKVPMPKAGIGFAEFANHVDSFFELLGPRPIPSTVQLKGRYLRNIKPFKIESTIPVIDGN